MVFAIVRYLLVLIFISLISGCAKDSLDPYLRAHLEKPDWISGESDRYPSSTYLLGRSVSSDLNQAKRQSADDLAKNLNKQIAVADEQPQPEVDKVLDQKTRDYLLQRIRVSEIWQDPATKAHHVLSTIDRVKVGEEMLNEVYQLDEQVERILKKANQEKDVLQRIAFANMAIEKQTQRDRLQAVVKVIKPVASVARTDWDRQKIKEQIGHWLSDIKILPIAQHKEFNLLGSVKDGVISAGMTVHFGARPDYILKETFNQGQIKWKDGVYSVEGTLQLELLDGEWKGQVRGDAIWPIEVSALERDQIPAEIAEAIKKAHQEKLRSTLLSIEE
jgi:hypothetical protein